MHLFVLFYVSNCVHFVWIAALIHTQNTDTSIEQSFCVEIVLVNLVSDFLTPNAGQTSTIFASINRAEN